jgi:hypothetical protein
MNFLIVLFKNKTKKKIINKFKTKSNALSFFEKKIKEEKIYFEKIITGSKSSEYELGLLEKNSTDFENYYFKDNLGRQIKLDLDTSEYKLIKISEIKIEETIMDCQKKKKITLSVFCNQYLKSKSLKVIFILNNKIFVQLDNDFSMFSLKNEDEALRFLDCISDYLMDNKRSDCLIVNDTSKIQKKYLYDLLNQNGFPKSTLYRRFTTFIK